MRITKLCILGYDSDIMAALEYVESQTANYNIAAVNLSLSGSTFDAPCESSPYKSFFDDLAAVGRAGRRCLWQ